jgi:hypothetical protein
MAQWQVFLYGIVWDDGKGEYDVSENPENLRVTVEADSREEAIENALGEASDEFDALIDGTEQIVAKQI